jgi:polyisoprenoid-binding protein YceI
MARFRGLGLLVALGAGVVWVIVHAEAANAAAFQVDGVHSSVLFRVKHMNTSYAWGRFNAISGKVDLDGPKPSIDVQLQVDSIDTANAKREAHLKGPDFFNAKQFPMISFKSTKITKSGDADYEVEGTLTLHGVSHPIKVRVERTGTNPGPRGGTITGLATTFNIKRSDYGMDLMLEGVSDDVLLVVSLECAAP